MRRVRRAGALAVGLAAVALVAGCGDDSDPGGDSGGVPKSVPAGAVVAVGENGGIPEETVDRTTESRVAGVSPLNGRATPPLVPLDGPDYKRCVKALKAQAIKAQKKTPKKQRTPLPSADQLVETCKASEKATVDSALSTLIQQQWAIDQAAKDGVTVSEQSVDDTLAQYQAAAGLGEAGTALPPDKARARYEELLKKSGLTEDDVRFQLRAQLSQQALINARLEEMGPDAAKDAKVVARVQVEVQNDLLEEWRPKTLCAKDRLVPQCANGPKPTPLAVPQ